MRMRVRSGWPSNAMPNMSNTSRSIASVPGWRSNSVGSVGSSLGHLHPQRGSAGRPSRSSRLTTTSKRSGVDAVGQRRGRGGRGSRPRSGRRTSRSRRRRAPCTSSTYCSRVGWSTTLAAASRRRAAVQLGRLAALAASSGVDVGHGHRLPSSDRRPAGRRRDLASTWTSAPRARRLAAAHELAVLDQLVQRDDGVDAASRASAGSPGAYTSTGTIWSTPCTIA